MVWSSAGKQKLARCQAGMTYPLRHRLPSMLSDLKPDQEYPGRTITLGAHTKIENTVRYLGIEVEDALEIAEQTES